MAYDQQTADLLAKVSEQAQRITNLIEVKDKLYYRCEQLEEALRELYNGTITMDLKKRIEALLSPSK